MASVSRTAFSRSLRALDADELEQFVAALWRARGWTVTREDGALVVVHPTRGVRRTIETRAVPWWHPSPAPPVGSDADLAVVNRPFPDAPGSVVDAADLYEMVRYAIDDDDRADLLASMRGPTDTAAVRAFRRVPSVTPTRVAAVLLGVTVLVTAVAGLTVLPTGEPAPPADQGPTTPPGTAVDADASTGPATTAGPDDFPPGLTVEGVSDPEALAAAHAGEVAGRPRVLVLRVEKYEDSRRWATYVERVVVQDHDVFASEIEFEGTSDGLPAVTAATEVYVNREVEAVNVEPALATDPQASVESVPRDPSAYLGRVRPYLRRALSVEGTDVVATRRGPNGTVYRVEGTYAPGLSGQDESVTAVVTSAGAVRTLRHEYERPVSDGSIVVTIAYEFGPTTVERPAWVGHDAETD